MRSIAFLIFILCTIGEGAAQVTAITGKSRSIPADLWGVCGQNTIRDNVSWEVKPLLNKLVNLHPMLLRYPGGDIGNWWDWRTGWFDHSEHFPKEYDKLTPGHDKPEDFKHAIDLTGATPIWTLNMVTKDLSDQLAMLRHVNDLGMPVTLVEFGSEFYLEGNEFIRNKYPTGADYARECNRWSDSIQKYFPEAKCAYLGVMTKGNKPNRRNEWNESMASAMNHPDAITLHVYPQQSMAKATAEQKGDPVEILSEPFRAMDRIEQRDILHYAKVPAIWITEYNMNNNTAPVQGTWLHGIYALLLSMKFLEDSRINHCTYFTMCGKAGYGAIFTNEKGFSFGSGPKKEFVPPPNPPETTPWGFSAAGFTLSIYGEVLNEKTNALQIQFNNGPHSKCGTDGYSYPALYGWKFTGGNASEIIILNLSAQPITLETTTLCYSGSSYTMVSAPPYTYVAMGNEMKTEEGKIKTSIIIKPYSVLRITEK